MLDVNVKLRYAHIAPRKMRLVADLVRGMNFAEARTQLLFNKKRSSGPILKLLESAGNNARHNFEVNPDLLYIKEIKVDEGPILKRYRARARGRAAMIRKRTSHVTLVLSEKEGVEPKKHKKEELVKKEEKTKKEAVRQDSGQAKKKEKDSKKTKKEVKVKENKKSK